MLKTLEEPPEYVIIILITSNEAKILNTIKSRCMKVPFLQIEQEKIEEKVREILQLEPEKDLIEKAEGSIGKAIYLQEEKETYGKVNNILENIEKQDLINTLNQAEVLFKEKENIKEILDYIIVWLYNTKDNNKLKAIKYVEETKKRINSNCNYDMCIDYLLMNLHREIF